MREIGGYIELDTYQLPMLHEDAVALNCGRNCLAYLIRAKNIRKILLPYFLCGSVKNVCDREGVSVRYYHIGYDFLPQILDIQADEWVYVVNYYGQISDEQVVSWKQQYQHIILDNAQAYFQSPPAGVDTLYTCRKYFGVADGAFLYTDAQLEDTLPRDESFERMRFLLGRFERTANEFYSEYAANNRFFEKEPIKAMSKLTENLLHGINYARIKIKRTENFSYLHNKFRSINRLDLTTPDGGFMYPLYLSDGAKIRHALQKEKIYIPTLWPDVFDVCPPDAPEYDMAMNILPLPIDQRYGWEEMEFVSERIKNHL